DLATPESWSKPISTRSAIEAMPENCVVVADAMGVLGAGIFGDILCMRMVKRCVSALITDGVMRDKHGVIATGLPVWCAGVAAPASVNQLTFVSWNEPIGCGGCAIFPSHSRRGVHKTVILFFSFRAIRNPGLRQRARASSRPRDDNKGLPMALHVH